MVKRGPKRKRLVLCSIISSITDIQYFAFCHKEGYQPEVHSQKNQLTAQTSVEISFLGSPKDSIFYSIARFFLSESNTVLSPECKIGCNANNLDLYRSTYNIAVDPHMVPIVSTVDTMGTIWGSTAMLYVLL